MFFHLKIRFCLQMPAALIASSKLSGRRLNAWGATVWESIAGPLIRVERISHPDTTIERRPDFTLGYNKSVSYS
jgi:hypothetical protein